MSTTKVGETSQKILCLGFVIQHEDTAQGVDRRMKRRFSSERFTRGIAHKSLPSLAEDGFLELVEEGTAQPLDRYRATPKGEELFYEWLRQTELPPTVRDATQCKLEFYEMAELPEAIESLGEQQEAFGVATDIAHERLQEEKRARRERRRRGLPTDWRLELRIAKAKDAVKLGGMLTKRLKELRADLQQILDAYNIEIGEVAGG
jgi:DNA-binding PadR family transcriptional regulator